jgi:hypothetical protein
MEPQSRRCRNGLGASADGVIPSVHGRRTTQRAVGAGDRPVRLKSVRAVAAKPAMGVARKPPAARKPAAKPTARKPPAKTAAKSNGKKKRAIQRGSRGTVAFQIAALQDTCMFAA